MPNKKIATSNNSPSGDGGSRHNMFYGANPILFELAEQLRAKMTPAEELLWAAIKINEWHLKFRRQHPISLYIADFYCHRVKLVIELDGGYHENKEVKIYDAAREKDIKEYGITVLRFKNEEIYNNLSNVLNKIGITIKNIKDTARETAESLNNSHLPAPIFSGGDRGKLFVIKIGGNVIDDENKLNNFLKDFAKISTLTKKTGTLNNSPLGDGGKCILIHGGGKIATKIGEQLGIQSNYIDGRRITDEATIDLVIMVYGGLVNKKIVARLQSLQCNAIGLTGADANIIPAVKRPVKEIDYGFAGDIVSNQLPIINYQLFLSNGLTPIIAPLTHDGKGQILNTNADTIASAIAVALSEVYNVRLIYCFEKKGVLENIKDESSAIPLITKEIYHQLKKENKLFDGILPKIDNAFAAIDSGVKEVLIGHADDLLQNVTEKTTGTLIKL
jgi:acetylglutamate kinase